MQRGKEVYDTIMLALSPRQPALLFVATSQGGFRSTGGCQHWEVLVGPLGGRPVLAFAFDPATPTRLYAGTFGFGVFRSEDGGRTWRAASRGLVPK
ncbi:MAG: hypothetical protein KatS3mg131_3217 [Candidatus Tectimicrobiota bacterium]|nr:MAG: hypothetical protein KatS3mg131_3217 [Candidatus Tectomicrobia bacterium]